MAAVRRSGAASDRANLILVSRNSNKRRNAFGTSSRSGLPALSQGRAEAVLKGLRCFTEKCAIEKRNFVPGQHGQSRRVKKLAGYGLQLREKQKVKRTYGLLERQFRNYVEKSERAQGPTGENLIVMLERRLDNAVWRSGLASSRSQARQIVLHGHVRINGKKVTFPRNLVSVGEEIALKEKMHQNTMVLEARNVAQSQNAVPWLEIDRETFKARVVALPKRENVQTPPITEQLIVELYSK